MKPVITVRKDPAARRRLDALVRAELKRQAQLKAKAA